MQTLSSRSSPRNGVCGTIRTGRAIAIAAALCATPAAAPAQSVADFYRGKTIEMMIGGAVGGGYDLAGRTVANHIGRHIPGNPGFVVRNMNVTEHGQARVPLQSVCFAKSYCEEG